jgi:glutamyl-Q tRNA(Asp) synthetase
LTGVPSAGAPVSAAGGYRGRFAPSPTGALHFGSLVAAVASYADARAARGAWLVRIEDVDEPRTRPGAEASILSALESLGFEWDGPVWRQSERQAAYASALERLAHDDRVYACACTRAARAADPVSRIGERIYPGVCRDASAARPPLRSARAVRVRVDDEPIAFTDRLYGRQQQRLSTDVGDFIVRRSDGLIAYQLAVVVDDAAQAITDIVRGADLLGSTPRQIHLQRLLGLPTPHYLHVPVAVDAHGRKLSKASASRPLPRSAVPALMAAWRFLGQLPPDPTPSSAAEFWAWATVAWRPARLPAAGVLPAPAAYN